MLMQHRVLQCLSCLVLQLFTGKTSLRLDSSMEQHCGALCCTQARRGDSVLHVHSAAQLTIKLACLLLFVSSQLSLMYLPACCGCERCVVTDANSKTLMSSLEPWRCPGSEGSCRVLPSLELCQMLQWVTAFATCAHDCLPRHAYIWWQLTAPRCELHSAFLKFKHYFAHTLSLLYWG